MQKTKITVTTIGHIPANFNRQKIMKWKSSLFEVIDEIENYSLNCGSDGYSWEYTDSKIEKVLPNNFSGDFLVAIVNVPIELNWFLRSFPNNRIIISFHEIKEILQSSNIPLENIIYRLLYACTLVYKCSENSIPKIDRLPDFTHDDTRGCLFDMDGIKTDIVYSCHNPIICQDCVVRLHNAKVSREVVKKCQNEIRRIQKKIFYRITDFIKEHPLWSLTISAITAIILGAIGSIIGSYIFEAIRNSSTLTSHISSL